MPDNEPLTSGPGFAAAPGDPRARPHSAPHVLGPPSRPGGPCHSTSGSTGHEGRRGRVRGDASCHQVFHRPSKAEDAGGLTCPAARHPAKPRADPGPARRPAPPHSAAPRGSPASAGERQSRTRRTRQPRLRLRPRPEQLRPRLATGRLALSAGRMLDWGLF